MAPEPSDEEIAKQRKRRFGALKVVAGAGLAAMAVASSSGKSEAQMLTSDDKMALTGAVRMLDHMANTTSTPERRVSLYKQIVEGFAETAVGLGSSARHYSSRYVFLKNSGRSAVAIDGELTTGSDGRPFMRDVSAYFQLSDRVLAQLQTFDFEPGNSSVAVKIVVLGNNVQVPENIIDIGRRETPAEIFERIPALFSGGSTTAITASINRATGEISNCGVMIPITSMPNELIALGAPNTSPDPITEIVLADSHPDSRFRPGIQPGANEIAARLWQGIAMYFASGT